MPLEIILCILLFVMAIQNVLWHRERKIYIRTILSGNKYPADEKSKTMKRVIPKYKRVLEKWRQGKDSE